MLICLLAEEDATTLTSQILRQWLLCTLMAERTGLYLEKATDTYPFTRETLYSSQFYFSNRNII